MISQPDQDNDKYDHNDIYDYDNDKHDCENQKI